MIISSSFLAFSAQNGLIDWNEELRRITNVKFRRASRFSQAVLCGALSCIEKTNIKSFSIYFGTANGDVDSTVNSQDNIFLKNYFPQPFSFINTLSGTPLFFLLQHLKLNTLGISLGHSCFAFENALSLAIADLNFGRVDCALTGVCDIWYKSANINGLKDKSLYEFSAWLLMSKDERNFVRFFDSFDDIAQGIKILNDETPLYLSNNFSDYEKSILAKYAKFSVSLAPVTITNYSSAVICSHFLNKPYSLFYAGKNPKGGYSLVKLHAKIC